MYLSIHKLHKSLVLMMVPGVPGRCFLQSRSGIGSGEVCRSRAGQIDSDVRHVRVTMRREVWVATLVEWNSSLRVNLSREMRIPY